jgi:hypothetical protein
MIETAVLHSNYLADDVLINEIHPLEASGDLLQPSAISDDLRRPPTTFGDLRRP